MSDFKKGRTILIGKESCAGFFALRFPDMRALLLKLGHMYESERIRSAWTSGSGDFVVEIIPWSSESRKNVRRFGQLAPGLRNFSPQKERGKNSRVEGSGR